MRIVTILLLAYLLVGCKTEVNQVNEVDVVHLHSILNSDNNIQLLDVRTPKEWEEGSIENAIKIDVTANGFEEKVTESLNKDVPVYVYCKSGGRSRIASEMLLKKGFKVYNVSGGYMEWDEKYNQ